MTPFEAVLVIIFFAMPILPPLIGEVCGRIYDAFKRSETKPEFQLRREGFPTTPPAEPARGRHAA